MADTTTTGTGAEEGSAGKKGIYSYAYFSTGASATSQITVSPPRKLTDEEVAAQQEAERVRNQQGASAWNHAGTFEERNFDAWAKERLGSLFKGQSASGAGGASVSVTNVVVDQGHANAWIVRGKKRHGFDFQLTLSWTATIGGKDVLGTAKIPNAASDELDDICIQDCQVDSKDSSSPLAAPGTKAAEQVLPQLVIKQLEQLLEELKTK